MVTLHCLQVAIPTFGGGSSSHTVVVVAAASLHPNPPPEGQLKLRMGGPWSETVGAVTAGQIVLSFWSARCP